uniref:GIY-YIG domain-containing protein n=1 Tax=viral metagenome TaxID=1070528 RepID=A0A6C0HYK8_9ZZZZ
MTIGFIYKIVFPNGKHYIGLTTTSLNQRRKQHKICAKNDHTKCVYNALRKYDMVDTFELIEIDTADTLEELCEKEIGYIIEYNSYYIDNNGYNMTRGGEGVIGYVFTDEDKQKMSEAQKKYFENPSARERQSESQKKRFENSEERKKSSEATKNYFDKNPDARERVSIKSKNFFEQHPEAGKEHSERMKKFSEEHPEQGKEHSERMKKHFENPEEREKVSERMKKSWEKPGAREKMSTARGHNKPFDVFKTDGTFIKTFTYQFEAQKYLQKEYDITSRIKISEVLSKKRNNSAGFIFEYKKNSGI